MADDSARSCNYIHTAALYEKQIRQLRQLLPEDEGLLTLLEKKQKKVTKREKEGVLDKSFAMQDYEKIKEWLER